MPKEVQEESESRAPRTKSGARHAKEPGVRVDKPETTSLGRIGLIISSFIFAGMVLFTLAGYERISRAYADINALNNEITLTDLRINELDVQIECAVTIQEAQEIAQAYGMQYPEKDQYVRVGDRLPFDNSLPSPTGTTEETTPEPETTPVPSTEPDTTGGGEQPPAGG